MHSEKRFTAPVLASLLVAGTLAFTGTALAGSQSKSGMSSDSNVTGSGGDGKTDNSLPNGKMTDATNMHSTQDENTGSSSGNNMSHEGDMSGNTSGSSDNVLEDSKGDFDVNRDDSSK